MTHAEHVSIGKVMESDLSRFKGRESWNFGESHVVSVALAEDLDGFGKFEVVFIVDNVEAEWR